MAGIAEESLCICFGLPHTKLAVGASGGRDAHFRYIRKAIDSPRSIETNFGDPDVLRLAQIWKKVDGERVHLMQFVRFQKAADGTFFAAFEPQYNALPLTVHHFKDRFADQKWIIYDMKRRYGFIMTCRR